MVSSNTVFGSEGYKSHRLDGNICPVYVEAIASTKLPECVRRNITASIWMLGNMYNDPCRGCQSNVKSFQHKLKEKSLVLRFIHDA